MIDLEVPDYVKGCVELLMFLRKRIHEEGGLTRAEFEEKRKRVLAPGINVEGYVKTLIGFRVCRWEGDKLVLRY